jgi:ATP-dependent protease ClpP protease subunit
MNRERDSLKRNLGRGWYRMETDDDGNALLWIYDVISFFGVNAAELVPEIASLKANRIEVHINSPGGDVFDAVAIYNALREQPAEVETRIDGIAASAASYIAQAGDRIVMAKHSMMMIHEPWGLTIGDAEEHRTQADVLDRLGDNIAGIYAERAGGSVRAWRERMHDETWYDDQEAVDAGLADEVMKDAAAVENRFDLTMFKNVPRGFPAAPEAARDEPSKRELETALREAGLSRTAALALIAGGWEAMHRTPREAADERALLSVVEGMKRDWSQG